MLFQVSPRRYEYRFIFVELEGFPPRTIIIEDNRLETDWINKHNFQVASLRVVQY